MASIISFTFRETVADVEYKGKGRNLSIGSIKGKGSFWLKNMLICGQN